MGLFQGPRFYAFLPRLSRELFGHYPEIVCKVTQKTSLRNGFLC